MTTSTVCQSCSMPLEKPADYGTEAGGTRAEEFCTHCYQGGASPRPT